MSTPAPNSTEVEWKVALLDDPNDATITFDTEENAHAAWLDNQPSALMRVTTEYWITDEIAALLPTPAQEADR